MTASHTPFKRITVPVAYTGYPTVQWSLRDGFNASSDTLLFYVEISEDLDSWLRLNADSPVQNAYTYEDDTARRRRQISLFWYRVVLIDGTDTYTSWAAPLGNGLNAALYKLARKCASEYYTHLDKSGAGTDGKLIKRKKWGTLCTDCVDPVTEQVMSENCSTCYGTGLEGGYFPAYSLYMEFQPGAVQLEQSTPKEGEIEAVLKKAKCPAFPVLEKEDVWVSSIANNRWILDKVAVLAEIGGVPLIYEVQLRLLEPGGIEYSIPVL